MGDNVKMTDAMEEIAFRLMDTSQEYFDEFAKENGKKAHVWVKDEETGQLVVYTRGEHSEQIIAFLETLEW